MDDRGPNENKMGKRSQRQGPVEDEKGERGNGERKKDFFAPFHDRKAGISLSIIYINNK